MEAINLEADRLKLIPLTLEQLILYQEDTTRLELLISHSVSKAILTERLRRALGMKIEKMQAAEEREHPWVTYWLIVVKEDGFGAGMVGFKGLPDENGEVEIGYGIDPGYQNKGYMTEAVKRLISWAFQEQACRSVIASAIEKSNISSHRVAEKVGMEIYHETENALFWRIDKSA